MVKLLFLYFSGTGNTDYVARYLARRLEQDLASRPVEIELRSMEWQPPEALTDFDLLALGFPVYAADSPNLVQAYLARLPVGEGRGAFVFCTKGAFAGGAVGRNLRRLAERRYVPLVGGSVLMPGTDGLAMVSKDSRMARKALEKDYDHLKDADRLARAMASAVAEPKGCRAAKARPRLLSARTTGSVAGAAWGWLYKATENYARSKLRADERCNGCGLCAKVCPVENIEMLDGHPRFADRCMLCLRCLHACPQEAIQIGRLTVGKFRWKGPKGDFHPLHMRPQGGDSGE